MELKRTIEQTVKISPRELAELFWNGTDKEQAAFFAELKECAIETRPSNWQHALGIQLDAMCEEMNSDGFQVLGKFAEMYNEFNGGGI